MSYEQTLNLLIIVVLLTTMLSFGMTLTLRDILEPMKRVGLLVRATIAAFIVVPAFAVLVVKGFALPLPVGGAILLCACLPVEPTVPKYAGIAKGDTPFAIGVLVLLSVVGIVVTPNLINLVLPVHGHVQLDVMPIIRVLVFLVLAPLIVGMVLCRVAGALAHRLAGPTEKLSTLALLAVVVLILWHDHASVLSLGSMAVLAIIVVATGSMAIGWMLGGPTRGTRTTMTIATAFRNLSVGLLVAATSFSAAKVGADHASAIVSTVVAVGVINLILGLGFAFFMKSHLAKAR